MEKWKTIAIIFMVLFALETAYIAWGVSIVLDDEKKINECYYDICEDYPDAWYEDNVCFCYDYDLMGNYEIAKTEYMKN